MGDWPDCMKLYPYPLALHESNSRGRFWAWIAVWRVDLVSCGRRTTQYACMIRGLVLATRSGIAIQAGRGHCCLSRLNAWIDATVEAVVGISARWASGHWAALQAQNTRDNLCWQTWPINRTAWQARRIDLIKFLVMLLSIRRSLGGVKMFQVAYCGAPWRLTQPTCTSSSHTGILRISQEEYRLLDWSTIE